MYRLDHPWPQCLILNAGKDCLYSIECGSDVDACADVRDDATENNCLTLLNIFSSKRHGDQSADSKLPRSIRLAVAFLGRLRVDLIKWVSIKCPSARPYICTSVRPQKVSSISMIFGM